MSPDETHSAPQTIHISVMPEETLDALRPQPGGVFIDGTLGGAGHTALLLERVGVSGRVLAIDADPQALARADARLGEAVAAGRLLLRHGNFRQMGELARAAGLAPVDGILLDLGLSSDQLAARERGFSFAADGALDMRFDPTSGESAADLVNTRSDVDLADIFWRYGEERFSRPIARRIVEARRQQPITRADELARLAAGVVHGRPGGVHPATRVFQALRIAVNDELGVIEQTLPQAIHLLRPGGRLAVISFHSLEDRVVKDAFRLASTDCICPPKIPVCVCDHHASVRLVTRKPLIADEAEIAQNPRSRSAKLRVVEKL